MSHKDDKFDPYPNSTKRMSFEDFLKDWVTVDKVNSAEAMPQSIRFRGRNDRYDVNYIINYSDLERQLAEVLGRLNVPMPSLNRVNESPKATEPIQISDKHRAAIEEAYAEDRRLIDELSGRWLHPNDDLVFRQPSEVAA
jgi:hypothetical protein